MSEDPRKTGLKRGLRQLTLEQLERVLTYSHEMVLDTYNYEDGKFCPLAVGAGLDTMENPSHEKVFQELSARGYSVYNTRGVVGSFYTSNRKEDLLEAVREVIAEKKSQCGGLLCKDRDKPNPADDEAHTCPFNDDVWNGESPHDTLCDCCSECYSACSDEI